MQDIRRPWLVLLVFTFITLTSAKPFFKELAPTKWSIGNDLWSIEIGQVYGTKLVYRKKDLIGGVAKGFYAGYGWCFPFYNSFP
jgi:general stress protein CsbA